MPLEFEQVRGLFGKKNDIFAEHFTLDWCDLLQTHPHNGLILGTCTKFTCCAWQFCLWSFSMWWELDCLKKVQPSSATFTTTHGWTSLCFLHLHTATCYLGGIFPQSKVFWTCSLLGFQPFSPKLLVLAVIGDCIDRPSCCDSVGLRGIALSG